VGHQRRQPEPNPSLGLGAGTRIRHGEGELVEETRGGASPTGGGDGYARRRPEGQVTAAHRGREEKVECRWGISSERENKNDRDERRGK
jgi:hypothetical protein